MKSRQLERPLGLKKRKELREQWRPLIGQGVTFLDDKGDSFTRADPSRGHGKLPEPSRVAVRKAKVFVVRAGLEFAQFQSDYGK